MSSGKIKCRLIKLVEKPYVFVIWSGCYELDFFKFPACISNEHEFSLLQRGDNFQTVPPDDWFLVILFFFVYSIRVWYRWATCTSVKGQSCASLNVIINALHIYRDDCKEMIKWVQKLTPKGK